MAIGNPITLTNNVASKIISVTATADQTLFTVTGGYRINQLAVFRNGVRLAGGADFTANDGASVTLLTAANLNDTIEFQIFDDFRVADAIQSAAATQTISGDLTVTGTIVGMTSVTGSTVGIQSAGTLIGTAQTINFIGAGNTVLDQGDGTIDVSISGSGGGGLCTALSNDLDSLLNRVFKTPETFDVGAGVSISIESDTASGGRAFMKEGIIHVSTGSTFHVGSATTLCVDVLRIF